MTEERWSAFVGKVRGRFDQVAEETRQGCMALLVQCDDDPGAMTNAFTAMERRLMGLESKVQDTFDERVAPEVGGSLFDRLDAIGRQAVATMERDRERLRIDVYAAAARRIWQRARAEQVDQVVCPQCSAAVPVPETFQSIHVRCGHCDGLVTFEPGSRLRAVQGYVVHPLAQEAAWDAWVAKEAAQNRLDGARGEPRALVEALEAAEIGYWRAYLTARARMMPNLARDLDKDLEGKMRQFYVRYGRIIGR